MTLAFFTQSVQALSALIWCAVASLALVYMILLVVAQRRKNRLLKFEKARVDALIDRLENEQRLREERSKKDRETHAEFRGVKEMQ